MAHDDLPDLIMDVLRATCDKMKIAVTVADPDCDDHPLIYANPAFLELTGYAADEVLGRNCRFLQGPGTNDADLEPLRARMSRSRYGSACMLNYRKDGSEFFNMLVLESVRIHRDKTILVGCQYKFDRWVKEAELVAQYQRTDALFQNLESESQQQLKDALAMRSSAVSTMLRAKISVAWARRNIAR